jgi:hypothetical protein
MGDRCLSMTIPPTFRSPRYNKLKLLALEIFDRHGDWLSPPEWAQLAGFYPTRSAYSYLIRLHRFGLLERNASMGTNVLYRFQRGVSTASNGFAGGGSWCNRDFATTD